MSSLDLMRIRLGSTVSGATSPSVAADQLCEACVELLEVDGAAISVMAVRAARGTFGASGERSRRLDGLQFTYGEGPCLDAVDSGSVIVAPDLAAPGERRWPALVASMVQAGVHAVFALPVLVASRPIGALDLYRDARGPMTAETMSGALLAAEFAAVPLRDLMSDVDGVDAEKRDDGWDRLAALDRVEVYQATGMLMEALGIDSAAALERLRAYAFAEAMTVSDVAWQIVERRLTPDPEGWRSDAERDGSS